MARSTFDRFVFLLAATAGFFVLVFIMPSSGRACSICRCGDPTFNALGQAGYTSPGLRTALDWERFDKDEGDPAEEAESQVENRMTWFASYGFSSRVMVSARLPYSHRELTSTEGDETTLTTTNGFSDPEIFAQAQVWGSAMSALGRRESLSLTAGVKTPWGQNDVQKGGERVDEHAQPGTGSTDLFASVALLHLIDPISSLFLSTGYRHTGENEYGYRYGSTFLANVAYERKLSSLFDGVLELNYRHAKKDQVNDEGELGDDTGGSLLYVTPRLLVNLGSGVVLRAAAQIPTVKDLNGHQTERVVANVGVTYLFSHE